MTVEFKGLRFDRPGHATVRIETSEGAVIYIDPWSAVLDGSPGDADIVFSTHDDGDHYDPDGIAAVSNDDTTIVTYREIDTSGLGREVIPLEVGEERTVDGVTARGVPAYNEPTGPHVRPSGEPYHPEGTVMGLVLTIDDVTVYFCSDTDALEELGEITADVVIPPIGGRPTMDRHEAAALVEKIGPELVLPVHYNSELVDDIDTDATAFKDELEEAGISVVLF